jgi:hypothetical protein
VRAALPILLVLVALPPAAEARLLDRVVAVVAPGGSAGRGTVVTLSELRIEARVALIRAGGLTAATEEIPPDTLAATLQQVIAEHLLQAEAEELAVVHVEPADERAALQAFQAHFPTPEDYRAFLDRWELEGADVLRILRRGLVVERYLASRARLAVSVSEAELRRAYDQRGGAAAGFEEAREPLREELLEHKREELVAALVADLRSRAQVRVLHDLGGRHAAGPAPVAGDSP